MTYLGSARGQSRRDACTTTTTKAFFQQYLNRKPTDAELAQYVGQFKAGGSQRDVQEAIINLPEYANTPPPRAPGTVSVALYPL